MTHSGYYPRYTYLWYYLSLAYVVIVLLSSGYTTGYLLLQQVRRPMYSWRILLQGCSAYSLYIPFRSILHITTLGSRPHEVISWVSPDPWI